MPGTGSVEFKVLSAGDEAILTSVATGVFDDPIDARAAREFLADPRHHIVVAIDNRSVVGFDSALHYLHPDKPGSELWINEVGVARTHQRRGIAKALLRKILEVGHRLNCTEAWVLTDRRNQAATGLYEKAGGVEAAIDQVMFTFQLPAHDTKTNPAARGEPAPARRLPAGSKRGRARRLRRRLPHS